jgi:RNase P/RNase MRP subunit p29
MIEGNLIGKTKDVLFLWSAEKVKVIPLTSSVKEMEIR